MYSISKHWKYISISIGLVTFLILLNNQNPTVEIDMNVLRNNMCLSSSSSSPPPPTEEKEMTNSSNSGDTVIEESVWDSLPVKGAIYMVVQNAELHAVRATIRSLEDRFNSNLNSSYPWILLNSQVFTDEFKYYVRKAAHDPTRIYFGQIDLEAWGLPYWIDSNRAENAMQRLDRYQVEKAHSHYFHQLQRYQSGLFMHHALFDSVTYVWQVETGTSFHCELFKQDPFITMQGTNKKLGFVLTSIEPASSMYSLWPATLQFMKQYANWILSAENSIMPWLIHEKTKEYTFCSIWTSFQIVNLEFLKSLEYQIYFQYLDYIGGFFYERYRYNDHDDEECCLRGLLLFNYFFFIIYQVDCSVYQIHCSSHVFRKVGFSFL